jgi:transmembrane sensor
MFRNIVARFAQARIEREAAEWLARLHSDDCDERTRAGFRKWLRDDEKHATTFEELTAVWELIGARAPRQAASPVRLNRRSVLVGGGAALTAAAGGFVALTAGAEVYRTDIGERRSIVLADRSKVLLDANTQLRVRNSDSGCEATLERGRAHFDLSSRTSGSLIVRAGGCKLRADRGAFEIETRAGEGARILMLDGSGALDLDHAVASPVSKLTSGHVFDESSTTLTTVAASAVERLMAWRDGRAVFSNDSVAEAVEIMNRYDRQRLMLDDEGVAKLRISGTFRVGDNAAFADALKAMLPVDVLKKDETLHLAHRNDFGPS